MAGPGEGQPAIALNNGATRRHERSSAEHAVKLGIRARQDRAGCPGLGAGVVKKQGDQGREEGRGHAVACGIREPKEPDLGIQLSPPIHIAPDLGQWRIDRFHPPAVDRWYCGGDDSLLGGSGDGEIGFLRLAPDSHLAVASPQLLEEVRLAVARALFLQASADARFEQSRLERLGQVILRAHPDAAHDRVQLAQSRNHDDRNVAQGFIGLEALKHFVAIHFRHHDVEQHEVEGVHAQPFQRLSPVFGGGYRVTLTL